jgi:hypothetical protein
VFRTCVELDGWNSASGSTLFGSSPLAADVVDVDVAPCDDDDDGPVVAVAAL